MIIKQIRRLNDNQKKDINKLVLECLKLDNLERKPYLNDDSSYFPDMKSFYLLYDDKRLVSVLTIFQPEETEAEITAYTHPEERNKGFFSRLLQYAKEELIRHKIANVTFVIEPNSVNAINIMEYLKAKYVKSEYLLIHNFEDLDNYYNNQVANHDSKAGSSPSLKIVRMQPNQFSEVVNLCLNIFDYDVEEANAILNEVFVTKDMICIGAYLEDKLIGVCNLYFNNQYATIFGFGIAKQHQGQGYGKEFLTLILNMIKDRGFLYITLHVSSVNYKAYTLYKNSGFKITTQYDYYEYNIV